MTPSCCCPSWTLRHGRTEKEFYLNDNGNFFNSTSGECFIGRKVIRNYWPASYGHSISPRFRPSTKQNPLSWHKILLDILFNTIFLLTWEDVCEGGRSFGRLLNPHEHKRTSNVSNRTWFLFLPFLFTLAALEGWSCCANRLRFLNMWTEIHVQSIFHSVIKAWESRMDDLFV